MWIDHILTGKTFICLFLFIYISILLSLQSVRPSNHSSRPSHASFPSSIELSIRASAPSSIRPSVRPCVLPSLTLTPDPNPPLRHPSIPFICPSAPLSRRLLLRYSINSTRPPLHPSVCVSVSLSIRPSVRPCVCSSLRPSVHCISYILLSHLPQVIPLVHPSSVDYQFWYLFNCPFFYSLPPYGSSNLPMFLPSIISSFLSSWVCRLGKIII